MSRLLAGELLLRDGFAEQAIPMLFTAAQSLEDEERDIALVALGDAWLLTGDIGRAHQAYLSAPHRELTDVLAVREVLVRMLRDGARRWPAWVPTLEELAGAGGPGSADALYLLAQVHEHYLDWEATAASLGVLWDHHPGARDSEVPARLLAACTRRVEQLAADGRDAEVVAVFQSCWREDLAEHLPSTSLLSRAVDSLEALGLAEQAVVTQLELTTLLGGISREDPLQIARLAGLQVEAGHGERALETLGYARGLSRDPRVLRRLDLEEGEALAALGRTEEAIGAFRRAASDDALLPRAEERAGVVAIRAGWCADAVPFLAPRLAKGPIADQPPGELELLLLRCAVQRSDAPAALAAAGWAIERAQDPWTPREARWLATTLALRAGVPIPESLRSDEALLGSLAGEDLAHGDFLARQRAWEQGR
jgi:tetratricopeptide (TPR) repeat protein